MHAGSIPARASTDFLIKISQLVQAFLRERAQNAFAYCCTVLRRFPPFPSPYVPVRATWMRHEGGFNRRQSLSSQTVLTVSRDLQIAWSGSRRHGSAG